MTPYDNTALKNNNILTLFTLWQTTFLFLTTSGSSTARSSSTERAGSDPSGFELNFRTRAGSSTCARVQFPNAISPPRACPGRPDPISECTLNGDMAGLANAIS